MDKVEKTKDNIGVSELDEETRKKLYERFVDAGGEVLTERQIRKNFIIDRNNQKKMQERLNNLQKSGTSAQKKKQSRQETNYKIIKTTNKGSYSLGDAYRSFKLRMRLKFLRVTQFNNLYFNIKFLGKFNNIYKPALMEVQVVFLNLFKKDLKTGNRIIARLDALKPIYYELIEKIANIYDKMAVDQIVEQYLNFPDVPKKVSELKTPLMNIFSQLYILKDYERLIIEAFTNAVQINQNLLEKADAIDSSARRKTRNDIFILFHKLYPRLHWLCCYYNDVYLDYDAPEIEEYLEINEDDLPGRRIIDKIFNTEKKPFPEQEEAEPEESYNPTNEAEKTLEQESEKKAELPEPIREGFKLMYNLNFNELRTRYDKDGQFAKISDNDPVLATYLLFEEFDQEYSFILTTNKIKFNTDFIRRGEYNYKTKLNDLYDDMRKPHDALKNYAIELVRYEKARSQRPVGNTQYIEYVKRLESINKKKNLAGRLARMSVKAYMDKVAEEMNILITDMDNQQKLIANPQDVLDFNEALDGVKKLNNLKIYEAIKMVFRYALAFSYRLTEVDESGEPAKEQQYPDDQKNSNSSQTGGTTRSIFDELDDLL